MDRSQLKRFCAGLPGVASRLHAPPQNVLVYSVGGKTFAYFKTSEPERWRFSLRVAPDRFLELTDVPGIKPARWLGRYRWVTIVDVRTVPGGYLKELVEWSYRKALDGLSRKRRAEALDDKSPLP
jgi:predicted DNA-binding protein (MmcQ/YjbR family)